MTLLINILSLFLVFVCLFLGLLILVQLPKKEAGMGAAFGGDATAALFGAGSGNALTNITKWTAGAFLGLCMAISWMTASVQNSKGRGVIDALKKPDAAATAPATATPILSNAASAAASIPLTTPTPDAPVPSAVPTPVPSAPTAPVAPAPAPAPSEQPK